MKRLLLFALPALLLSSCEKKSILGDPVTRAKIDSIMQANAKTDQIRMHLDSIAAKEGNTAIKGIDFGIGEKELSRKKAAFLKPLAFKESEFYMGKVIAYHKLGEYRFNSLRGNFHQGKLYQVGLYGPRVRYDDYDIVMPEQYQALVGLLTEKYGAPTVDHGLPAWSSIDKGYVVTPVKWVIGPKEVRVQVSCEGVDYNLNLDIRQPAVVEQIAAEQARKAETSTKKAASIL